MRRAAKTDDNQRPIVKALRDVGAVVQPIHMVGKGCPDLLVAFRGEWYVAEIKDGSKSPSQQTLTPDEEEWHDRFCRAAAVHVWRNEEEALRAIGAIQ